MTYRASHSAAVGLLTALTLTLGCPRKPQGEARREEQAQPSAPARDAARSPAESVRADAASTPSDAGAPAPVLHRAERMLMGTIWAITIVGGDRDAAKRAAERAFDEVARLEALLSEWQPDSEISRVNAAAGKAPVAVGPELLACVRASLEVARWSDGAYDISWAGLRRLWDFSAESAHVPPSRERVRALLPLWNWRNIVLDEAKSTVFLKRKGMQIGLGGVAKGYALDRAGELLQGAGFHNYLIYGGGQVLTHGKKGERPWRVGVQHPREGRHFAYVEIEDGSLATSGDYEHAYRHDGRLYHHIIDPKTGFPSEKTASVTLIASNALWADAVDTAIFIMGPERGLERLASAPGGPYQALVVDPSLRVHANEGMRERLFMTAHIDAERRIGATLSPDAGPAKLAL